MYSLVSKYDFNRMLLSSFLIPHNGLVNVSIAVLNRLNSNSPLLIMKSSTKTFENKGKIVHFVMQTHKYILLEKGCS